MIASTLAAGAGVAQAAPKKLDGALELTLRRLDGATTQLPDLQKMIRRPGVTAPRVLPVIIELDHEIGPGDVARLEALGVTVERGKGGRVLGSKRRLAARLPEDRVASVAGDAAVKRVALDGRPFTVPRPLDLTARMIQADAVHRAQGPEGEAIAGQGITVCDVDAGIDGLHPMFFQADAGLFDWNDENKNGKLDPGIDTIDIDGQPRVLRALNGIVSHYSDELPLFGTDAPGFDLRYDYLYADLNDDGARNTGSNFGFTEESPGLGEPLFVVDDVDQSGIAEVDEKLAMLGTPKIKAFRVDDHIYRRGENLLDAPWDPSMQHGNGAAGVMVGGQLGYRRLTGMAPGADLVVATDTLGGREFAMTSFCIDEGARVVLHEYAPWVTYHLDGSSDVEQLIDETVGQGVVHVNPVGNLSGSRKGYEADVQAGQTTVIPIDVPPIDAHFAILTMLYREPERPLHFTLTSPNGDAVDVPFQAPSFEMELGDFAVTGSFDVSDRGTAKLDIYLYPKDVVVKMPVGQWSLSIADESPAAAASMPIAGFVFDDVTKWGLGINFASHASEAHLIGWPATADHGIAVAAHTGHGFDGGVSGARAAYSGRGHRIDGASILAISAPDNPIVPARFADRPLSYMVYGGTSGASPHVAGAAALLLSHEPRLDGDDVRARLEESAVADGFTGRVPNDDFGYGKLNVHRAVFGDTAPPGYDPVVSSAEVEIPRGPADVAFTVRDPDDYIPDLLFELDRDYDGVFEEVLASPSVRVDYAEPGRHVVKVRVTDASGRRGQALLRIKVVDDDTSGAGGGEDGANESILGGGCAASSGALDRTAVALLGLSLVLLGARRRARGTRVSSRPQG